MNLHVSDQIQHSIGYYITCTHTLKYSQFVGEFDWLRCPFESNAMLFQCK